MVLLVVLTRGSAAPTVHVDIYAYPRGAACHEGCEVRAFRGGVSNCSTGPANKQLVLGVRLKPYFVPSVHHIS